VLLVFYVLMFASYNELNELFMSYLRAYGVESSFKSKLVMLMSQAELTHCFNKLERIEPSLLGSARIPALSLPSMDPTGFEHLF
jgi:hypothetical protein